MCRQDWCLFANSIKSAHTVFLMVVHDAASSIPAFEAFVWGVQPVLNTFVSAFADSFGGAFVKSRIATISLVLSFLPHGTARPPLGGFS